MRDDKYVILYVDDDQDMLDSMRAVLESNGYIMDEACTGEDGLRVYKGSPPDFLIVDLMMEEIDAGTNFVKELRVLGNTAPIYMLSSMGDQLHMSVDASELGLVGVFQKPVNFDMLLKTIESKLKK